MWILFDDAREGGAPPRLYRDPVERIVAWQLGEIGSALDRVRSGLKAGKHAAGYLAYEAGHAFDPKLAASARKGDGPLLSFGLFDRYELPDLDHLLPDGGGGYAGRPRPRIAQGDYEAAARRVRDHLFAGDFYQANLTFGCDVAVSGSPLAIYARLRQSALAGWGGVLADEDRSLISLSPEQFFTIRGGMVEARPMKGTAPRRTDPSADAREAEELAADEKQRAENLMIVDLMRNDLARVSETGSVDVPDLFAVETYPTIHQMVSRIISRLREGFDAIDVLRTIFPCGSGSSLASASIAATFGAPVTEPHGKIVRSTSMASKPSRSREMIRLTIWWIVG